MLVPRFEPFAALRYDRHDLDDVVAPPYDVLSDDDVDELAARHPYNIVHVDVPRERDGALRYEQAGERYRQWIADGVLAPDPRPSFTIYRMRFVDATGAKRDIAGVVGALEVVDEGGAGVLPHERVTPKASTDRLDLTRATKANLSPIWGLSLAAGLTDVLAEPGTPLGTVHVDGVEHVVERVDDPERIAAIRRVVESDDVLIADGHHRYGVARQYRDERRATGTGVDADLTLAFVNELVADQLSVEAIHRLYRGVDAALLRERLADSFDMSPAGRPTASTLAEMVDRGALVLIDRDGQGTWMVPRAEAFDRVRQIDGALLEHALAGLDHEVTYQHGLDEVVAAVTGGDAVGAVLIRPVSVAEIERTAREGVLMPPKSTFFTPKLRTGLFVRPLA